MNNKKQVIYVKYPLCLSYLFTPTETRFIMHMLDIEFMKRNGFNLNYSRSGYMKKMGLTEYSFDSAIKKMIGLGLLTKTNNKEGNKVYYSFNSKLYDKLISILSVTTNIDRLIQFCNLNFKELKRTIDSITEDDVEKLKTPSGNRK